MEDTMNNIQGSLNDLVRSLQQTSSQQRPSYNESNANIRFVPSSCEQQNEIMNENPTNILHPESLNERTIGLNRSTTNLSIANDPDMQRTTAFNPRHAYNPERNVILTYDDVAQFGSLSPDSLNESDTKRFIARLERHLSSDPQDTELVREAHAFRQLYMNIHWRRMATWLQIYARPDEDLLCPRIQYWRKKYEDNYERYFMPSREQPSIATSLQRLVELTVQRTNPHLTKNTSDRFNNRFNSNNNNNTINFRNNDQRRFSNTFQRRDNNRQNNNDIQSNNVFPRNNRDNTSFQRNSYNSNNNEQPSNSSSNSTNQSTSRYPQRYLNPSNTNSNSNANNRVNVIEASTNTHENENKLDF